MKDQAPRTTAMGLYTHAAEMLEAAELLIASGRVHMLLPTYYLLGHSMELALKSVLLASGESLERLRKSTGHDLSEAARRVIALNLSPVSDTVREDLPQINGLNCYYVAKEFEYRVTGTKRLLPEQAPLATLLKRLLRQVKPHAKKVHWHDRRSRRGERRRRAAGKLKGAF